MNPGAALMMDKASKGLLLALAFILPLAFDLKTFDQALVKDLLLQTGGTMVLALAVLRTLETGRLETPAPRLRLAAASAALLLWCAAVYAARTPLSSAAPMALRLLLGPALFLVILKDAASISFLRGLSGWISASACAAALYALLQAAGLDPWHALGDGERAFSTLLSPDLLGPFLAFSFPMALSLAVDPESRLPWRAGAGAAAFLCLAGLVVSGSPLGLLILAVSTGAYAGGALAGPPLGRAVALAALAAVPAVLALSWTPGFQDRALLALLDGGDCRRAAARLVREAGWGGVGLGGFAEAFRPYSDSCPRIEGPWVGPVLSARSDLLETAAELGPVGAVLWAAVLAGALALAGREAARRLRSGQGREGLLILGQGSALLGLLAGAGFGAALRPVVPGALAWLVAGSLAGAALETGSARVWVLPVPLHLWPRRALGIPVILAWLVALSGPLALLRSDRSYNLALHSLGRRRPDDASRHLEAVSERHPSASEARLLSAALKEREKDPQALWQALALYRDAQRLSPRDGFIAFRTGDVFARLGDRENAFLAYRRAVLLDRGLAPAWRELADAAAILGRRGEALAAARGLIRAAPDDPASWRLLSDQYRAKGRALAARRMNDKARKVRDLAKRASSPAL